MPLSQRRKLRLGLNAESPGEAEAELTSNHIPDP